MTEETTPVTSGLPTVIDSKLYEIARTTPMLQFLIPDLPTQMMAEEEIESVFPRLEEDADHTRILINYTNLRKKAISFKFNDTLRLKRRFDVDGFLNGFTASLRGDGDTSEIMNDDPMDMLGNSVITALNFAVATTIGLNDGPGVSENTKLVSTNVLSAITAALFDDALDIIIAMNELPAPEGETETSSVIVGMWIVKQRVPEPVISDLEHFDTEIVKGLEIPSTTTE